MSHNSIKLMKIVSAITFIVALLVIIGWFFNIPSLRTITPSVIAMRLLTAICFLGCSLLLYSLAKSKETEHPSTTNVMYTLFASFFILLLMVVSLFNVLGVNFNIEEIINYDYVDHAKTFPVSVPSVSTMVLFTLIGLVGLISVFASHKSRKLLKVTGIIISIISLSVLLGYLFGIPILYFAIQGISNAMAIHTGILFLLIGIAFYQFSKTDHDKIFEIRYTISQKISIGFFVMIALMVISMSITSMILRENNINLKMVKEVENPLEIMTQEVIGYDGMLTGYVHWAMLDYINHENDEIANREAAYDDIGEKLNQLLKHDAKDLLAKSLRGTDDKQKVYGYLAELDKINLALVDLEKGAFAALKKGDIETALKLVCEGKYYEYKDQLKVYYQNWADEEKMVSDLFKQKNLDNLQYIFWANLILGLLILIVGIILSRFILKTITNPLNRLDYVAKEISAGNIDVKVSQESKRMPGVIGDIANSFDRLLESSHTALNAMVEAKTQKYKTLFESSTDALMTLSPPDWKFTAGNKATLKMFNVKTEKEFNSLPPWELSPKTQPDGQLSSVKAKKMIEIAMKKGSNYFEWTHKRYKGESFPTTVLLSRIGEGKSAYLQSTVRDLSKKSRSR